MSHRFDDAATLGGPATPRDEDASTLPPSSRPQTAGTSSSSPKRFSPGSLVAGRYRLVALLGKGGMGEVYRAEDLTLDQPVALKFLPEGVAAEGPLLAQFHNELRVARQVSHKNVCRLYDLGEADGRRFLTMEYVDGEDLASLLRRIGRIPQDKAIQLARQLCAGLSAAHEKGVLHRDLKPANVMIDGNGDVRLSDFGIAVAAGDAGATLAGTPQYMAPEQLKGSPASVATDIYSLGLTLFEIFTGKRTHTAKSVAELQEFHKSGVVATPTTVVKDLDPAVERVIMHCLDRDPAKRPHSALAVAAALPGHDGVAAALAAGETPSPDLLVAAAETSAMPARTVLAMASTFVVTVVFFLVASNNYSIPSKVPLSKPPEVILDRADRLFEELGYKGAPQDRAYGTYIWTAYESWASRTFPSRDSRVDQRYENPEPILLWYRTSSRPLNPLSTAVTQQDPPLTFPGMRSAWFEMGGRLIEFEAVPPTFDAESSVPAPAPNWEPLFVAAGLSRDQFTPVEPQWTPPNYADLRAAWTGSYAGKPELPVRIEAASYRGQPMAFRVLGPWNERPTAPGNTSAASAVASFGRLIASLLLLLVLLGSVLVARYNIRKERVDYRGARRLAFVMLWCGAGVWLASPHGNSLQVETTLFARNMAYLALYSAATWAAYVAVEPLARRYWPDGLLGSSRLLAGHIRDPRVGSDLLRGLLMASVSILITLSYRLQFFLRGQDAALFGREVEMLAHPTLVFGNWAEVAIQGLFAGLSSALIFVLARLVFKRSVVAGLAAFAVLALINNNGGLITAAWPQALMIMVRSALTVYITMRFGLLVLFVTAFVAAVLGDVPMTLNPGLWYSTPALITLAAFAALLCFAVYTARDGQPLLGESAPPVRS